MAIAAKIQNATTGQTFIPNLQRVELQLLLTNQLLLLVPYLPTK